MKQDPHGQPFNVRFNRARRAERDLSEFLGLAKGLLVDGHISTEEARLVANWIVNHQSAAEQWPLDRLVMRLQQIFADGTVEDEERQDLAELLSSIVGGEAGMLLGEDTATELPIDQPPKDFIWRNSVFVFTGKFAYGPRAECQRHVTKLGARCADTITQQTSYLVIGTFGSRDWVHTSFGRKIEKAVEYREAGLPIVIAGEDHWVRCLEAAV